MKVIFYIIILSAILFSQSADNFVISVRVNYIAIELLHLDGAPYVAYTTAELEPGDTASVDSVDGIWIHNQSNINIGLVAWAFDDSAYIHDDSLLWKLDTIAGRDTFAVGISLYNTSTAPDVHDAQWLTNESSIIALDIVPGMDKYGYFYFVAPTDSVKYLEPQHRTKITIGAFPE